MKGKRRKNTNVHLQKANEIGGTNSTPPLATIKFDAMNIGWINKRDKANKFLFWLDNYKIRKLFFIEKCFVKHHRNS